MGNKQGPGAGQVEKKPAPRSSWIPKMIIILFSLLIITLVSQEVFVMPAEQGTGGGGITTPKTKPGWYGRRPREKSSQPGGYGSMNMAPNAPTVTASQVSTPTVPAWIDRKKRRRPGEGMAPSDQVEFKQEQAMAELADSNAFDARPPRPGPLPIMEQEQKYGLPPVIPPTPEYPGWRGDPGLTRQNQSLQLPQNQGDGGGGGFGTQYKRWGRGGGGGRGYGSYSNDYTPYVPPWLMGLFSWNFRG